jgi:hypothetical protein
MMVKMGLNRFCDESLICRAHSLWIEEGFIMQIKLFMALFGTALEELLRKPQISRR